MKVIGGTGPQDVALSRDAEHVGDSLSIALSQLPTSTAAWTVVVYVSTTQGAVQLGQFTTNPPASGDPAARIVGFASCPGAKAWKVVVTSATANDAAEFTIESSKCCAGTFGVTPATPGNTMSQQFLNVPDLPTLNALVATSLLPGTWAWVRELRKWFEYDPTSALAPAYPADLNQTDVVTATGGGQWLAFQT